MAIDYFVEPAVALRPVSSDKHKHSVDRFSGQKLDPGILFITSYPPRECGIATYSQDLIKSIHKAFGNSLSISVCALETGVDQHVYPDEVKYVLNIRDSNQYPELIHSINRDINIRMVMIQHEFGLFNASVKGDFLDLLDKIHKPVIIVFHTVLPNPDVVLKTKVVALAAGCTKILVMTRHAGRILTDDYGLPLDKIEVIAHGTHLVPHMNKASLRTRYGLEGKKVLSTFGLLSSGKGIETTIEALPAIVHLHPDVIFLVIGKTHPGVVASEGELYRNKLEEKVNNLKLGQYVRFVNQYLPLEELLEYLQLTDIYLFTSKAPNQAVSGTFSYAMSCACPIISTPIPHAVELLSEDTGIIIDFNDSEQLSAGVNRLMSDETLRAAFSSNTLHKIAPTSWENSGIAHALLFQQVIQQYKISNSTMGGKAYHTKIEEPGFNLKFRHPPVILNHVKKMTTSIGMIQFSIINQPDIDSGYTLDDNARALIALCMNYELDPKPEDLHYIGLYLNFIGYCQQVDGSFLNYVDNQKCFTIQNHGANLEDANGRAVWALGYLISKHKCIPADFIMKATRILQDAVHYIKAINSTRAMAFIIKGLFFANMKYKSKTYSAIIRTMADRLIQMYRHESDDTWKWYESYLTYANSVVPEGMLFAWLDNHNEDYKKSAKDSFDFLLSIIFKNQAIKVISNKTWLHKGQSSAQYGEQPIDVAYTIQALYTFYNVFWETSYWTKMNQAFDWFLGNNHLHQIMYNPCTGGCCDGLEENHINLNQGAESTLSYLIARLTVNLPIGSVE